MNVRNVMVVFGTRPEAIKMAPVIAELRKHPARIRPIVTLTGQHREMLDQVMQVFSITADHDLNVMKRNQTLSEVTCSVIARLGPLLEREQVDFLLVQGDTTTTFAAALSAFYYRIPVGHIEAGLRTYDKQSPYPEEVNRVLTTHLSTTHFAPTETARNNLLKEGVPEHTILVTGNTVIDALLSVVGNELASVSCTGNGHTQILVTAHRRENWGKPLEQICGALVDIVEAHREVHVIFPVHLNPKVRETVHRLLGKHKGITLTQPLGYQEFARQLARSYIILTDSGGVQEEAPALGKPVLVLRNETERVEAIAAGTCRLVGTDRGRIVEAVGSLLTNPDVYARMARATNPYGDGKAAERIVRHILYNLQRTPPCCSEVGMAEQSDLSPTS